MFVKKWLLVNSVFFNRDDMVCMLCVFWSLGLFCVFIVKWVFIKLVCIVVISIGWKGIIKVDVIIKFLGLFFFDCRVDDKYCIFKCMK